jgi:hypothetical protein
MTVRAKPRRADDWLPGQLAALSRIFEELAYGVGVGIVTGWQRRALEHRVRRLLPDVARLAEDAGLPVEYGSDARPPA